MNQSYKNFLMSLNNKKVMFCGLGRSNLPVIDMLRNSGAYVIACDSGSGTYINKIANQLSENGIEVRLGKNCMDKLDADIIFRTPGMKFLSDTLNKARKLGIAVTSEMEVFFDLCPCKIIGITGSDGKTTVTTIISEILKYHGYKVHIGGNIGRPILPNIENISENDVAVVELSSFQLISMRRSPDIAVVTNLAPNHLDIHKDMEEYTDAKKNIIIHQNAFGRAVLNADNKISSSFQQDARGEVMLFSRYNRILNGSWIDSNGTINFSKNGEDTPIIRGEDIKIPGNHNLENYLAAITAVYDLTGIESIKKIAKDFSGVEHRVEFVKNIKGVNYYNDSIASSPTRTISGTLSLFKKKIILIAGGYDKKIPFDELGDVIPEKVKVLILLGDTSEKIKNSVCSSKLYTEGNPRIIIVDNMEQAVKQADLNASSGDIVALSPACASFGLYKDFEERGRHFKDLINKLNEGEK